jgi:hypothetical protein
MIDDDTNVVIRKLQKKTKLQTYAIVALFIFVVALALWMLGLFDSIYQIYSSNFDVKGINTAALLGAFGLLFAWLFKDWKKG